MTPSQSTIVPLRPTDRHKPSWEHPDTSLLLGTAAKPAPAFPSKLLGGFWAEWCEEVSASANAPFDYAGASLLTLAGSLIGNARVAAVKGWSEPPILWSVLIGNPSSGKSPAMDPFMDLIAGFERGRPGQKLHIGDASVKPTAQASSENPKGLLLFRDELSGWWATFSQLGGEQFWLSAFGARPHEVRRANEEPIQVARLAVSVLGGSQPDTIRGFVESKTNRGFASRWLYVFPDPQPAFRLAEATNHVLAEDALGRLLDLPVEGPPEPCALSHEALPLLQSWVTDKRMQAADEDGIWAEWLGKQGGMALRLALILEHLWWAAEAPLSDDAPRQISRKAYEAATTFIDGYSAPMAARVLDMASSPIEERAAVKLARLLRKGGTRFNARGVRRGELGPAGELAQSKVMAAACEILEAAHLIRHVGTRIGETIGRKSSDYEVNPALLRSTREAGAR